MTDHHDYFAYLQGRGLLGLLYRKHFLYPRLCGKLEGRALDVGCGIGDFVRFRPNTEGVDINPKTVQWCKQLGLTAHLMTPDKLPFGDACFDSVLMDNVLEHVPSPSPLLAEIRRVLKPRGCLLVGVPGRKGYASDPDHKVFYDEDKLRATVGHNGFQCMEVFATPLPSPWLDLHMKQYCLYGSFRRS